MYSHGLNNGLLYKVGLTLHGEVKRSGPMLATERFPLGIYPAATGGLGYRLTQKIHVLAYADQFLRPVSAFHNLETVRPYILGLRTAVRL